MSNSRRLLVLIAAVTLLVAGLPAQAAPPETVEEPISFFFPDPDHGVAVFWNTTRNDVCVWWDGGQVGPPPAQQPVEVKWNELPGGVVVVSFQAERYLEIWRLDDDADLSGPCTDTDGQPGPMATGSARVGSNDNDLMVSGTRTNSFGERAQGRLVDDEGAIWHYWWTFHAHIDHEGQFEVIVDRTSLRRVGG